MRLKEAIQKYGQRHLCVKSDITSVTTQYVTTPINNQRSTVVSLRERNKKVLVKILEVAVM